MRIESLAALSLASLALQGCVAKAVVGVVTLSASGDCTEAAARLYACLHEGARAAAPRIAVAPVPDKGVGRAINDRLRRAAA